MYTASNSREKCATSALQHVQSRTMTVMHGLLHWTWQRVDTCVSSVVVSCYCRLDLRPALNVLSHM